MQGRNTNTENAGNQGGNVRNAGNLGMQDGNTNTENAGNLGGNARNKGGNAENRIHKNRKKAKKS